MTVKPYDIDPARFLEEHDETQRKSPRSRGRASHSFPRVIISSWGGGG